VVRRSATGLQFPALPTGRLFFLAPVGVFVWPRTRLCQCRGLSRLVGLYWERYDACPTAVRMWMRLRDSPGPKTFVVSEGRFEDIPRSSDASADTETATRLCQRHDEAME
jgi:hypothetical protein